MTDSIEAAYRRGYRDNAFSHHEDGLHIMAPYNSMNEREQFHAWLMGADASWTDGLQGIANADPPVPIDLRERLAHTCPNE